MILAVDIGNTNITMGVFNNGTICCVSRLSTDRARTDDQYAIELKDVMALHGVSGGFDGAVVGSVVPELTNVIAAAVEKATDKSPLIIAAGVKTGLEIRIDNPKELGADLVAGAVGAITKYTLPCLVIDMGTATKLSVIDSNGRYLGCTISAGIRISLDSLAQRTSQLPAIALSAPSHAIGTNSADSIRSGTVLGTAAMLDGLADKLEKELGESFRTIVATGGLAGEIVPVCDKDVIHDRNLILEGLYEIYRKNR